MVENNNSSNEQNNTGNPLSSLPESVSKTTEQTGQPYSVKKQIGIVLLIVAGVVIGIPFLLFMTCMGIIALAN